MELAQMEAIATDLQHRVTALEGAVQPSTYSPENNYFISPTSETKNTLVTSNEPLGPVWALMQTAPPTIATQLHPHTVAVSPDGNNVYVTNEESPSVSVYTRNGQGVLTHLEDIAVEGKEPGDIACSPDGDFVFVTVYREPAGVEVFERNRETGTLTRKLNIPVHGQCTSVAVDDESEYLIVGAEINAAKFGGVNIYSIPQFELLQSVPLEHEIQTSSVAITGARGVKSIYAVSSNKKWFLISLGGVILQEAELAGCRTVAVSPDGNNVYIASSVAEGESVLFQYSRGATGELTFMTVNTTPVVSTAGIKSGTHTAIAPDGRSVYVAQASGVGGIKQLARSILTGALTGFPPENVNTGGAKTFSVAISPDGLNVYATNYESNTLSCFATQ